jgi:hypothetical protein
MTLLKFPFSPLFYIFIWGQFKLWFLDSNKMHHRNNISMRYTFLYLFICSLHKLMPLVEYVEKKNKKNKSRDPQNTHLFVYLFILLLFWKYIHFGSSNFQIMNIFKERCFDLKPLGNFSLFSQNWSLGCYTGREHNHQVCWDHVSHIWWIMAHDRMSHPYYIIGVLYKINK